MKTLILILSFTMLLISCGGSSSGGSDKDNGGTYTRRNPSKPTGQVKVLSAASAQNLLEVSRTKLENISLGDVFEMHDACEHTINGVSSKGDYVRKYTVVNLDKANKRVSYKVDVIRFPGVDDCGYVGTEYRSFILTDSVYGRYGDNLFWYIENLIEKRKYGIINSGLKNVLFVSGEVSLFNSPDDSGTKVYTNKVEIGADLNQSFLSDTMNSQSLKQMLFTKALYIKFIHFQVNTLLKEQK